MDVEQQEERALVLVKTLTDRVIKLDYTVTMSVRKVKEVLSEKELVAIDIIRLIRQGTVLADDNILSSIFPEEPEASPNATVEERKKFIEEQNEKRKLYWFYYEPTALLVDPIEVVSEWDAKNRLRIFKGLYCFSQRRFEEAANLLCDSLATFAESDFIPFLDCVKYAVVAASFTLERPSLYKKVLRSSEVLEVLHEMPAVEAMVKNLYECRYAEFFKALAQVESILKSDWLAFPHYRFIVRELRITSYNQVLAAYKSLSLQHMAQSFGVTTEFIDKELSAFVASGRVRSTINYSAGIVETRLQDSKNDQYMKLIEKSDSLMDQMHKLAHLVQ